MEGPLKLLIVDDDEVDRMIIRRSLRTAQVEAEVQNATTGEEALAALKATNFDFIFIDFMLPDMNGLELLQVIREKGITTPVQIVTSQGDERIAVEAIKTGASDYLPKTLLTPEGISQSIRTAVRLHKIEQERLQTQEQLRRTQEQLETVVNGAPIILWAIDAEGRFTMTRGKGLSLIGKSEGQSVGMSMYEAYQDNPTILACVRKALKGAGANCTTNVQGVWFDCLYLPMTNANSEVTGVIGVGYDITSRVKSEEELKKAKDEALSMAQVKEQFLANMSHEIRTPMNGILGLTEVLSKTNLNDQQREYLKAINTSANNLMVIINDLLDFSKIEAGKITLEIIPFDLRQLIKQLLDILDIRAKERKNSLKLLLDDDIPQFVEGDPFRLSQILNNLIGNAIKFTENGTIKLSVEVLSAQDGQFELEFTVRDSGIGIQKENLETIFEKFTQGSNDTTRKFGGTGLGLSIAKELIEVQGGSISVQSEAGVGSTFTFALPFKKVTQQPEPVSATDQPSPPAQTGKYHHLRHARLLLAEDNPINQMLVQKVLGDQEIKLEVVNNGLEAVEILEQQPFDLVLMDMQMPEMDGYEAMRHIRQQQAPLKNIPIIALTAHASQGEADRCLDAGADSYVSKPFQAETLLNEIARFLPDQDHLSNAGQANDAQLENFHIDLKYLEDFAHGNVDFMVDILQLFLDQIPEQVQELTRAVSFSNWPLTRTIAHRIKPSLALVGIKAIEDLNTEIEQSVLHRSNLENVSSLVQRMVLLVGKASEELKKIIQQLKKQQSA
ncbi:response regulator [Rufibacter sp. LB8]|uniref:hybrid sensor histidine kinase/response regulator n=1 Tax=Rufibacter sp. LB8 TaxID=2777781 RepID=UPI00178C6932|nr:response regulator [Rufibacter sp. LB8]